MRKLIERVKNDIFYASVSHSEYIRIRSEFIRYNSKVMFSLSSILAVGFGLFFVLSYFFNIFQMGRLLFAVVSISNAIVVLLMFTVAKRRAAIVTFLKLIVIASMYFLGINTSLIIDKDNLCINLVVLLVLVPLIFSEPALNAIIESTIVVCIYLPHSYMFKSQELFARERVDVIAFAIAGVVLHMLLVKVRAQNALMINELEKSRRKYREQVSIIKGLGEEFDSLWLIYGNTFELKLIGHENTSRISDAIDRASECRDFMLMRNWYIEKHIEPADRERVRTMTETKVIQENIERGMYRVPYTRVIDDKKNYHEMCFVKAEGLEGKSGDFIMGFRSVDQIMEIEKERRNELEHALSEAQQASIAKTTFLNNMSHDIRTPMNAIIGYTDLLEKYGDDENRRQLYLGNIKQSSEYLLNLINEVLEMARIESGRVEFDWQPQNLYVVIEELRTVFETEYIKKHLHVERKIFCTDRFVYIDKTKFQQVFLNVMSNAVKYTPDGGTIYITMKESECGKDDYRSYEVTIRDTGIGMSKEFLPHIFDSFAREKTVTENKIVGTGLGMGIVKSILDAVGGTVNIESELGYGTKVTIQCEFKLADSVDVVKNEELHINPETFKGKRILLAEDNELNREIASELLRDAGFEVECAEDGVRCVSMVSKSVAGYYDIILMDIQMPNMDGLKAASVIRMLDDKALSSIPIIAMTANVFYEDKQKCFDVGMNGFAAKPIDLSELYLEFQRVLK